MRYETIIEQVQDSCGLEKAEAVRAVEALVETLGERLQKTERDNLADQLPGELKEHLFKRPQTAPFGLEEFYTRMAARTGLRFAAAVQRSRCAAVALQKSASQGELDDVRAQLRPEYDELFGQPPSGPMSPTAVIQ
jgi:uncharacterized protein (DUF2267 family)